MMSIAAIGKPVHRRHGCTPCDDRGCAEAVGSDGGRLYLAVAAVGGWAHGYVRTQVYVPGDAVVTMQNVAEHASLVRHGFVADLTAI